MTANQTTTATIRALLSDMEPAEPQTAIVAYLAAHEGQKLTKRDETKMQDTVDSSIRFRNFDSGMPTIEWGGYSAHGGNQGGCLFLMSAEGVTDRRVSCAVATVLNNPSRFSAREERNAQRRAALRDNTSAIDAANAIDAINKAHAVLDALCEYGEPLNVIRYKLDKLLTCAKK